MPHEIVRGENQTRFISNDAPNLIPGSFLLDVKAGQSVEVQSDLPQDTQNTTVFPPKSN